MMTQFSQILCTATGFCTLHSNKLFIYQSIINCNSLFSFCQVKTMRMSAHNGAWEVEGYRKTYGGKHSNALKECKKCLCI